YPNRCRNRAHLVCITLRRQVEVHGLTQPPDTRGSRPQSQSRASDRLSVAFQRTLARTPGRFELANCRKRPDPVYETKVAFRSKEPPQAIRTHSGPPYN